MAVLADLLDDSALGLVPVVDNRRGDAVRWAATSELPDPTPFLEGGEVLLTTGLETASWARQWDGYVRRLAGAGVVAVGLGVGLTYASPPAALVRACTKHGVDLFEVPAGTTFVATSRALAALLEEEQDSATRAELAAQQQLTQAALREDDPTALLDTVAGLADAAAVADADGSFLLGPRGRRPDLLDPALVAEAIATMRPQGLRATSAVSGPDSSLLVHPLGMRGRPSRYLVTAFSGRIPEARRGSITTAVALLSLAEERRRAGREADRRLRSRALELLGAGDLRTATVVLGAGAGTRPRLPRRAVILRGHGVRTRLEDGLEALESVPVLAAIVASAREELVAVVRAGEAEDVARLLADKSLQVGVGVVTAPPELARSHETAGHALALTTREVPVAVWDDRVRGGVLSLIDEERVTAFGQAWLAPLHDAGDPDLLETLRAYLRHHGALLKVAEELGVHRNTVRNRVERIEVLLGRSLIDPQVRVDAWVALRAGQQTPGMFS